MTRLVRNGIFVVFAVTFLVTAPLLIFLASGYRYNFAKNKVEQTGQLLVTSKPNGAEVRIDGQAHVSLWKKLLRLPPSRTPLRIKNLLSGQYRVDISEKDSWPWSRTVNVIAQQTSFVTEIVLFPKATPKTVASTALVSSFFQPNATTLVYSKGNELFGATTDSIPAIERLIWRAPGVITRFEKSPLTDSFIVQTQEGIWLITGGARIESTQLAATIQNVRWTSRGAMIAHSDKEVLLLSAKGSPVSSLAAGRIADVIPVKEDIYYLDETPEGFVLKQVTSNKALPRKITELPSKAARFVVQDNDRYLAIGNSEQLYVVELSTSSFFITPIAGAKRLVWLAPDEAIASGDFEIWRYVFQGDHHEQNLITRQSTPITMVAGYDGFPYVLFTRSGRELVAMELYPESPNTYLLAEGNLPQLTISKNGKELLMSGSLKDERQGIFSLPL